MAWRTLLLPRARGDGSQTPARGLFEKPAKEPTLTILEYQTASASPLPGVPQQPDSDFHQGPARLSAAYSLTHTITHTHTHSLTHTHTRTLTHTHTPTPRARLRTCTRTHAPTPTRSCISTDLTVEHMQSPRCRKPVCRACKILMFYLHLSRCYFGRCLSKPVSGMLSFRRRLREN